MDAKSKKVSPHILLLINILLYLNTNLARATSAHAVDTISKGEFLSGNQTISSKNGRFELGFFTPGSSGNYYIGIWFKSLPNQTVVWVANREVSVKDPAASKLLLSETGNLILSTTSNNNINIPIWSTNSTTTSRTAAAVLLNTGNLKLFVNGSDQNSAHVWQSFDNPTDTALPGSWSQLNKITGEYQGLTSWKNSENPSRGLFSEGNDLDGSNQLVIYRNLTKIIWSSGLWNGAYFEYLPTTDKKSILNFSFIAEKDRTYSTYTAVNDDTIARTVMATSGQLVQYIWFEDSQQWQSVSATPVHNCDVYELCGAFGVCEEKSTSICQCLFGFEPTSDRDWKLNDWSNGCTRKSQLQCGNNDWFFEMDNTRLPDNPIQNWLTSRLDCEASCRNDCSCNAYAYDDDNGSCKVWKGELQNTQLHNGNTGGATLFLRLSAHDMPPSSITFESSHPNHNHIAIILGLVLSSVILITYVVIVLARVYQRRRRARLFKKVDGSLIRFHYRELQRMTKNFTKKLGSGGFGTVYKGEMPNSIPVAIKLLQGLRQGEKEFRAEVSTLGAVQHVNLVRLRGFCFEGSKRLLVYELMPKGSLDAHLFNGTAVLNWSTRYQIALGTAKGLAYLHEECRKRVIHCDIKPDNILLDENFVPKVADFGLAKLYDRDFSKVLTSMRGTIGYLAPEWISGSEITPKVDVYSYGMMLFEMISGKRNRKNIDDVEDEDYYYYPSWAARQIMKGDVMSILDSRLSGVASLEEVNRVGKVAIWCIQDMEECRPTMGQIVQILEGVLEVNMPPISQVLQIHQQQQKEN